MFNCANCSTPSQPREKAIHVPTFRSDRSIASETLQHAVCAGVVMLRPPDPVNRKERRQLRARGAMTATPWRDAVQAVVGVQHHAQRREQRESRVTVNDRGEQVGRE